MSLEHLHIVNDYKSIDLDILAQVDFDARIDTKFVFPIFKLNDFLIELKGKVCVLEVNNERAFDYKNRYFDYSNFEFFRQHHAGYLNRIKVRSRQYSQQGPFVFEIKTKTNKSKTSKERIKLTNFGESKSETTEQYLQNKLNLGFNNLTEEIAVNYNRITLANLEMTEKFTLDINLTSVYKNKSHVFEKIVIAELKQDRFSNKSFFIRALKKNKIYPSSFSKYCTSILVHRPDIKHNRFKPLIKKIS